MLYYFIINNKNIKIVMDYSEEMPLYRKRYRINKFLGKGGQAQVYLVTDLKQNKFKALKIVEIRPQSDQSRLITQPKLITKLDHQNIIKAENYYFQKKVNRFDKNHTTQELYVILQYIEGGDLTKFLGKLSIDDIKNIYKQVRKGLQYLHDQNIIHRDIGLKNIMLGQNGIVKIIDFGISSQLDHNDVTFTVIGNGTQNYKPPQLYDKVKIKTPKGDLWSLGVMILELILGKHINQILLESPGSDATFPQMTFLKHKIPKIFRKILQSLLVRDYTKRRFQDLQMDIMQIQQSSLQTNKIILEDDYIVYQDPIGYSRSGLLYNGFSKKKNVYITIKILQEKYKKMDEILHSAQILIKKMFTQKNVLRIYDLFIFQKRHYLIMQFCQHGSLKNYLQKKKRFTQLQTFNFMWKVVEGIAQMNKKKYFHRNISPSNIYIKTDGQPRIANFIFITKSQTSNFTDKYNYDFPDFSQLDLNYVCPAILKNQNYNGLCDVWSLGCIIYELLTGEPLFKSLTINELIKEQEQGLARIFAMQNQYHEYFKKKLVNMLYGTEQDQMTFIDLEQEMREQRDIYLVQMENRTKINRIFRYIDFLNNRGYLFVECAQKLKVCFDYPIEDFYKYTLIFLLYGRYIHVLEQLISILKNTIINLPNKQNINISNFDVNSKQYYQTQLNKYMNDIIQLIYKYMDIITKISVQLFNRKKKYTKIIKQYQYLFQVLQDSVASKQLKQSNSFFLYNYKLLLLTYGKLKNIKITQQAHLRIYNFSLKLVNINHKIPQQNYIQSNIVQQFYQKIQEDNLQDIIKQIENIHKNVEGQY